VDLSSISILCVGDLMLDRYIYGEIERISPEAPVPVLRLGRTEEMLGGAGNVVNNIASLGGRAVLVGLIGTDEPGARLRRVLAGKSRIEAACVATDARPTICKTRFIAGKQQVVRTDEESLKPLTAAERSALLEAVRANIGAAHAVVLADYAKGALDEETTAAVIAMARAAGAPTFVDPKAPDFARYQGVTCITPNLKELAAASGMPVTTEKAVVAAARRVLDLSNASAILATRSDKGMMLIEASGKVHSAPARARAVFDVSGAGDTVIAAMALLHAAGRPLSQAMHVANAAASVVVSKFGTACATMSEVMQELDALDQEWRGDRAYGVAPLNEIKALVSAWKEQGLVVGFTNGCFDILHPGHVSLLAQARSQCDRLIVALNTDDSVRRLKGPTRPVNPLEARARVIAALRHVDCVASFEADTPLELIRALRPDVLVKGADYALDQVVGADVVQAYGGRVVLAKLTPGQATTAIIARLQQATSAPKEPKTWREPTRPPSTPPTT
jgi:D-beta-D-heptose 7-phosphate kinase / D-beta-D-heptose 1-phosphate adenosyltransferase